MARGDVPPRIFELDAFEHAPGGQCQEQNWMGGYGRTPRRCQRKSNWRCGTCGRWVCGTHAHHHRSKAESPWGNKRYWHQRRVCSGTVCYVPPDHALRALHLARLDERVARALNDENAYWRTAEVRIRAIRDRAIEAHR